MPEALICCERKDFMVDQILQNTSNAIDQLLDAIEERLVVLLRRS